MTLKHYKTTKRIYRFTKRFYYLIRHYLNRSLLIVLCFNLCLGVFLFSNTKSILANSLVSDGTTIVIDGESFVVDSDGYGEDGLYYVIKNGIKYVITQWANSNMNNKNMWLKSIAQGTLTLGGLTAMADMVDKTSGVGNWVLDGVSYGYEQGKQWVLDGFDKVRSDLQNGTLDTNGSWLAKKLLGAVGTLDGAYDKITDAILDKSRESSMYNYYDQVRDIDGVNSYVDGRTKYYSVYNDNSSTFYNTYNNTYEYVTNYNYDIYNDYYNYYTTENHYHVTNNYNNTYVFNTAGSYDYELYYKLPDGSNSFNLNPDEIHGIRTDLTVDNYQVNYSNSDVLGLFHFNGNNLNSINNDLDIFYEDINFVPYNATNYVDSVLGFDTCYMSTGKTNLFGIVNENVKNVRFKFYNTNNSGSGIYKLYLNHKMQYLELSFNTWYDIEINIIDDVYEYYVNGILQDVHDTYRTFDKLPSIPSSYRDSHNTNTLAQNNGYSWYEWLYDDSSWYVDLNRNGSGNDFYVYDYKKVTYWCPNNNTDFNNYTYRDTTILHTTYQTSDFVDNDIFLTLSSSNYFMLDELRIGDISIDKHDVNYLPFADGIYYTLPDVDTNNKVLIQSTIPVHDFQFGGIRKGFADSVKGDVFFYCVDGVIQNIQQFDGADWILVEGALYSEYLGKWVNAVGYSVYLGAYEYKDVEASDVVDDTTMAKWFSGVFNDLSDVISKGFDNVVDGLKDLLGVEHGGESIDNPGSITIDSDIDVDVESDLSDYINDVKQYDYDIDFDLETDLGSDLNDVRSLATSITPIFDVFEENNLSILWVAPLIVLIVRLVI